MDASGSFGRALIDLGSTHSVLLQDEAVQAGVTSDSSRVHPVAHAPGGTLLWHILESKGSSELENVTSGSLQVRGLVQSTFEKNRPMYHFQVPKTLTFKTRISARPFSWKWLLFAWEWKNDFHINTFALSLTLKQSLEVTQKWHISMIWLLRLEASESKAKEIYYSSLYLKVIPLPFIPLSLGAK